MSTSSLAILANPNYSHVFDLTVYYPDGVTIYSSFTSDQYLGSADSSSLPSSKSFDAPPVVLSNILAVKLPENVIFSRQIISWPVEIKTISRNGLLNISNTMWKGKVNSFSKSGGTWSMELASELIDINKKGSIRLLANCPLVFGSSRCSAVKVKTIVNPTTLIGVQLSFPGVVLTIDPKKVYQIVIGDVSYAVSNFITSPGFIIGALLDRSPILCPDYAVIENTCNQSLAVCRDGYQNNARWMGCLLPSSVLSLTL